MICGADVSVGLNKRDTRWIFYFYATTKCQRINNICPSLFNQHGCRIQALEMRLKSNRYTSKQVCIKNGI